MGLRPGRHGKQPPLHIRNGAVQFPFLLLFLGALLAEPVRLLCGGAYLCIQLAQAFFLGFQAFLQLIVLIQEQIDLDLP